MEKGRFVCQECGAVYPRYQGQCYHCNAWNSIVEEREKPVGSSSGDPSRSRPTPITQVQTIDAQRLKTGISEFDRVTGGGIVPGSLVLIGGSPGIGKSTLLLSISHILAEQGKVLYVSGEESPQQVKLRAERLKALSDNLLIHPETDMDGVISAISSVNPIMVVIDSIQTMNHPALESAPGSVAQVRESTALLQRICKRTGIPVFLVGHVTKSGAIAGPMVLEHIVDTVLFFEGEGIRDFRILRTLKNRFGSTHEIGVFTMESDGLKPVDNPSELFISHHSQPISGSVVVPVIEGTRTVLIEIQALITQSGFGMPARRAEGVSANRLALLLAVLEKRARILLGSSDVFVNVAGGIQVDEPATDLGIILAIASSFREIPLDPATCAVGEIGLGGEVRGVVRIEERLAEAEKLGFRRIIIPAKNMGSFSRKSGIQLIGAETVRSALKAGFPA